MSGKKAEIEAGARKDVRLRVVEVIPGTCNGDYSVILRVTIMNALAMFTDVSLRRV